jgi:hypothetical protein
MTPQTWFSFALKVVRGLIVVGGNLSRFLEHGLF